MIHLSQQSSSRVDEDEDSMSLPGTWRTSATSTTRSGQHMLSSSFEWEEDQEAQERRNQKGRWRAFVEEEEEEKKEAEESIGEEGSLKKRKGVMHNVDEEMEEQKPRAKWKVVTEDEQEDRKENKLGGKWSVAVSDADVKGKKETSKEGKWTSLVDAAKVEQMPRRKWKVSVPDTEVEKGPIKPKRRWKVVATDPDEEKSATVPTSSSSSSSRPQIAAVKVKEGEGADTEVTVTLSGARQRGRELRTRRISDTQVREGVRNNVKSIGLWLGPNSISIYIQIPPFLYSA